MIRFILSKYGFEPVYKKSSFGSSNLERVRMGKVSKWFGTAAVYKKSDKAPKYKLIVESIEA